MAAVTNNTNDDSSISSQNAKLNWMKMRDCGLEYLSTTGKLIPAKSQPNIFCHCPQRCQKKLPREKWKDLFSQFYGLADQDKQNAFIQSHIEIKRFNNVIEGAEKESVTPASKRRVTCKYHVPVLEDDEPIELYLDTMSNDSREVCQKAFMNIFGITEKRVRMQREKSISMVAPDYYPSISSTKSKGVPYRENETSRKGQKRSREVEDDQPLDLSNRSDRTPSPVSIEIDKTKLYELAAMLGLPKETVNGKMLEKYEGLVRKNLKKQQKALGIKNKVDIYVKKSPEKEYAAKGPGLESTWSKATEASASKTLFQSGATQMPTEPSALKKPTESDGAQMPKEPSASKKPTESGVPKKPLPDLRRISPSVSVTVTNMKSISEQVIGLRDDVAILPIQTVNNGDLTITPIIPSSAASRPVQNQDIMQVNSFFQNQLWRPEFFGLPAHDTVK